MYGGARIAGGFQTVGQLSSGIVDEVVVIVAVAGIATPGGSALAVVVEILLTGVGGH